MNCINRPPVTPCPGSSHERRRSVSSKSQYGKPYTQDDVQNLDDFRTQNEVSGHISSRKWRIFQRERFPNRTVKGLKHKLSDMQVEERRAKQERLKESFSLVNQIPVAADGHSRRQFNGRNRSSSSCSSRQKSAREFSRPRPLTPSSSQELTPSSSQDVIDITSSPPSVSELVGGLSQGPPGRDWGRVPPYECLNTSINGRRSQTPPTAMNCKGPVHTFDATAPVDSESVVRSRSPSITRPDISEALSGSDADMILDRLKRQYRDFEEENTTLWANPEIARGVKSRREYRTWKKKDEKIQNIRKIFDEFRKVQEKEAENRELKEAEEDRFRSDEQTQLDDLMKTVSRDRKKLKRDIEGLNPQRRAIFKQICFHSLPETKQHEGPE